MSSCARANLASQALAAQPSPSAPAPLKFDGTHAYDTYLMAQMNLGFRPAGSPADRATGDYIAKELKASQWTVVTQDFAFRDIPVRNIIGQAGQGKGPVVIIGAHYDTRLLADQDKQHPDQPVAGANDGASGVAVLLELARTLDVSRLHNEVWLAFFDAEDDGDLSMCPELKLLQALTPTPSACDDTPWPWSVGATYVAEHLTFTPSAVVVIDMIGDKDQNIYYEQNSDAALQQQIWAIAGRLGYAQEFIPSYKWSMEDDHTPFLKRGFRAIDIIDFDYPYWHTVMDTADKVSGESLGRVGTVLKTWLEETAQ